MKFENVLLNLPSNETILKKSNYNDQIAITSLFSALSKLFNTYAISALFYDHINDLFSPIYCYPSDKKIKVYVKFSFSEHLSFEKFKNRDDARVIHDIQNNATYSEADIIYDKNTTLSLFTFPIRYLNKFMGVLNIYIEPEKLKQIETRQLEFITQWIAERVANLKIQCFEKQKEKYIQEGEKLLNIKTKHQLLHTIIHTCVDLSPKSIEYGFIGMVDESNGDLLVDKKNVIGWSKADTSSLLRRFWKIPAGNGVISKVIQTQKPYILPDADSADYGHLNYTVTWPKVKSNLCIPIIKKNKNITKPYAVVSLESTELYTFSQKDIDLLNAYLKYASPTLDAIISTERFQDITLKLGEVIETADKLLATGESDKLLTYVANKLLKLCCETSGVEYVAISIKSLETNKLGIVAYTTENLAVEKPEKLNISTGYSLKALEKKEIKRFNSKPSRDYQFFKLWKEPVQSGAAIPIVYNNEGIGIITLESKNPQKFKDDEIIPKIKRISELIAKVIADARYDHFIRTKYSKKYSVIYGKSRSMEMVKKDVLNFAQYDLPVLILGDSGTGKELVARRIHYESNRRDKRMIEISSMNIPIQLAESELFGYKKGAFTGADRDREGKLDMANGGTIFIDELGDMPLELQGKFLRFLQEGQVLPLGEAMPHTVDVRTIVATNKNLLTLVKQNKFREDLLYRLSTLTIKIPPLRERKEDIRPLCQFFLEKHSNRLKIRSVTRVSDKAFDKLVGYDWPGNVRQLEDVIIKAIILAKMDEKQTILTKHIIFLEDVFKDWYDVENTPHVIDKNEILKVLYAQRGNRSATYKILKKSRTYCERVVGIDELRKHAERAKKGLGYATQDGE